MITDSSDPVDRATGGTVWAPSHLRQILLDAGVGSTISIREVARRSGRRLHREWVRLLLQPIPAGCRGARYNVEHIEALGDTLRLLGVPITTRQLERAVMADLGYPEAVSEHTASTGGDQLAEILARVEALSDADRRRLLVHLSALLAPAELPTARRA